MPKHYDLEKLSDANLTHGGKALEMIMHDVIDGMEELANLAGYDPKPGSLFEVLEIEPADTFDAEYAENNASSTTSDKVVSIKKKRKQAAA